MKSTFAFVAVVGLTVALVRADEPVKTPKDEYAAFSNLVRALVLKDIPKEIYDESGWGQTTAIPPKLPLPRLRTLVKVGDQWELPHGFWRKVKVTVANPAKDVTINVREFKPNGKKSQRLVMDLEAAIHGWTEVQHWQKGLALVGFIADADAVLAAHVECDVILTPDTKQFPPAVHVDPTITNLKTSLKDFTLQQVTLRRLGTILEGQQAKEAGDQFKGLLESAMQAFEPQLKTAANQAIAQAVKNGKGKLSAGELLKALGNGK